MTLMRSHVALSVVRYKNIHITVLEMDVFRT